MWGLDSVGNKHAARHSLLAVLGHSFAAVPADSQAPPLTPQAASAPSVRWPAAHAGGPHVGAGRLGGPTWLMEANAPIMKT